MVDDISDEDRVELSNEKRVVGRDLTIDELLMCPLRYCKGVMSVEKIGGWRGKDHWKVWCPECRGWVSEYTVGENEDAYEKGVEIWLSMREEMRGREE